MILIKFDKLNEEVVQAHVHLPKFASDIEALILPEDWKKAVQDMAIGIYIGGKRHQALVDDFTKVPEYKASESSVKHIENIMKFIPAAMVKRGAISRWKILPRLTLHTQTNARQLDGLYPYRTPKPPSHLIICTMLLLHQ